MKKISVLMLAFSVTATLLGGCNVVTTEPTERLGESASSGSSESMGPATPLEGATLILKMSHGDNDTSMLADTWNCYARVFKKSLELYSGGEMSVDIYPNDQLGGTESCLEQCSQGTLDIALSASAGALSGWVPNTSLFDVPYLIDDMDACNLVCDGAIKDDVSADLQAAANMRVLSMLQTDFRNVDTWNKPVRSVEDLSGLKMRVQELAPHIAMVEAWGAVPTSVAFTELYSAASTGVIDCFENCNYTLFMNNLFETVNYITETRHAANVCICVMNQDSWERLTEEQQDIVTRAAIDARRATLGVVTANNVNLLNELEESGVEIIALTDEERAKFSEACFEEAKAVALQSVEADFYENFMAAYENAKEMLGRN